MDLLEVAKLYGGRMGYHGNILLKTNGRKVRQRQKAQFCRGERGKVETENLIMWVVVLELLAGGW